MLGRLLFYCCVLAIWVWQPVGGQCQEKADSEIQIYDVPGTIIFVQSESSAKEHVQDFLDDFMESPFPLAKMQQPYPDAINPDKPIVYYGIDGGRCNTAQLPFDDREAVLELAIGSDVDADRPFALKEKYAVDFPLLSSRKKCRGLIKGTDLITIATKSERGKATDDSAFDVFKDAKLLNDSLDPRMNAFVNRAGYGVLVRPSEQADFFRGVMDPFNRKHQNYNAKETQLLEQIQTAFAEASFGGIGLTYVKQQLNGEMHVKFSKEDAFEGLLDFEAVKEKPFKATVGLPADDLLASISLQTSSFASPEVPRFLLKSAFPSFGVWSGIEQEAALFQLTGNLVADSWKDVDGVRIGLYGQEKGTLSVVAIFDAKEPEEFFLELEKLIAIVEPEVGEEISDLAYEEFARLISDLGSRKYAIRERAETRLAIAGKRAVASLKKAIAETDSAEIRMRATRLINRIERKATSPKRAVSNLNFWANLDPEFVIEKGQKETCGMPSRMIRVRLPKTLSDERLRNARLRLEQLFGEQWDQVPVVRVNNQFVAMFGYEESMLKATVDNLKNQNDPLGKLAVGDAPYFIPGNMQVHASFQRLEKMFVDWEGTGFMSNIAHEYKFTDVLTSVSLSLSPDYWQCSLNMPVQEVRSSFVCGEWLQGK